MTTIHHLVLINAPVAKLYAAISTADGISTWWDKQTPIQTNGGLILEHNPGPEHGVVKLRVVELIQNKRVKWECISSHPKNSPASAWTGTHFVFEMAEHDDEVALESKDDRVHATTLDFSQSGYDEGSEFFESNNLAWGEVLRNLKKVVESQHN